MNNQQILFIPIHEIRIVNPRARKRVRFQSVVTSIGLLGLKKPITVHQRGLEDDGTRYDLVCGQGRLEAVRDLGHEVIPAIITTASEDERYLMSLVENLARHPPRTNELVREVRRLQQQHCHPVKIAQKLGLSKGQIYGILGLLRQGEDELIAKVEAGQLPLETAIIIASGKDEDIQHALSEAYDSGVLRGSKLKVVQGLIRRRKGQIGPSEPDRKVTANDLVRAYEYHTQQQRAMVRRSAVVTQRLSVLTASLRRLWSDDHFLTLLRAEGLQTMPEFLAHRIGVTK